MKEKIKEEYIKKDCLMYVKEKRNCNGLNKLECKNCNFYKPATERQKEKYVQQMKNLKIYIG